MRWTSTVALATVLAGFTGAEMVPKAQAHGIGGIHIGGLGGLHLGGLGGFGGFHGGGFHGGGFHGGGMHVGGVHAGSGFRGGAASLGGAGAMGGARGASGLRSSAAGPSFASRYAVASTGGKLGSANAAATRTAGSTTAAHSVSSSSTFLAQHGGATSGAGQGGKSAVVQANHVTSSGAGNGGSNAAAAGQGSSSPYSLGPVGGVLVPSRGGIVGFPWIGNSLLYYGSNGYGNSPYGFSYGGYYDLAGSNGALPNGPPIASQTAPAPALSVTLPSTGETLDLAALGETEFRAGNFQAAMNAWRHAMLDDAKNQVLVLMYGQALFAIGKYDEAAGAVQHALRQMPDDKWGVVVDHYAELYRGNQDYTDQLRALEAARNKPETDTPAVRFLLGYHYGYLGYPKNAVAELDKTLSIVPDDTIAKQLRDMMAAKLPPAEPAAAPAAPATK